MRSLLLVAVLGLLAFPISAHADADPVVVVDQDVPILVGVPDEIVFTPPTIDQIDVPFSVSTGAVRAEATLSWGLPGVDLDMTLVAPDGTDSGTAGQSSANPEVATLLDKPAGDWVVHINPFVSGPTTAHLKVVVWPASGPAALTTAVWGVPSIGRLDNTSFFAHTTGGTPPYTVAWDADGNGTYETVSATLNVSLTPGDHLIGLQVTDSLGVVATASQTAHVWSQDRELSSRCGGDESWPHWAMEFAQTRGTCWIHDGHHTYFFDKVYALDHIHGFAFAVEQQLAPGADSDLRIETSMDGIAWTQVGTAHYVMVDTDPANPGVPERQEVPIDVTGTGQHFRYVRVHSPPSLSQGLSGYLDHTEMHIVADDVGPSPTPTLAPATVALTCENDIMERFSAEHPCTYGGIDRYDSVSIDQTYIAGDGATLDRVTGNFTLAPFRADDFTTGHRSAPQETLAYLLTSVDARTWTLQATIHAVYGQSQSFDVALGGQAARFVRLFPEYHASFDDYVANPPLHHTRAYFVHSAVTLEGTLPTA